jgi:NAD(P)-dependent dehydrogenase (short-subunit alcohol dehydrogenase family)
LIIDQQLPSASTKVLSTSLSCCCLYPSKIISMSSPTKNKVLIVFGATGAVGQELVKNVLEEKIMGADIKVVAVGTESEKCKQLEKQYKGVQTMTIDAKDMKQVTEVFEKHKGEGIHGVVNLMGDYHYCPLNDLEEKDLMSIMQDNLTTSFNVLKAACPVLAESGGGSITCVGAAIVHYGMKNHEAWAAAKGAVEAMHRSAAATYAAKNVRINCVAAGLVESGASAEVSQDPQLSKASAELYPLKRLATPQDIAWAAAWLAHPKTTYTTGCALPVDGGISTVQTAGLGMAAAKAK